MKIIKTIVSGILIIFPVFCFAAGVSTPVVINIDEQNKIISGLTKQNTEVIVYIDDKFYGMAQVNNSDTDTDNFYFGYKNILEPGTHKVSIVTRDKVSNSLSVASEAKTFNCIAEKENKPKISAEAASEKVATSTAITESTASENNHDNLAYNVVSDKNKKILIWNLAVFVFFLSAVVGWIIWVNKELKKDKQKQETEKSN